MAAVDAKLAKALKDAFQVKDRKRAFHFALGMKGGNDGALLVSRVKISEKERNQVKARCGGAAILVGRCFHEDGKLVFETLKLPPSTATPVLKRVADRDAGKMSFPFKIRMMPLEAQKEPKEDEAAPEPEETPAVETAPTADDTARLAARQKTLLLQAQQGTDATKQLAKAAVRESAALAARKDFAGAHARLDKLENLLNKQPPAPPPPPPRPRPAAQPAPRTRSPEFDQLAARQKALLQRAREAATPLVVQALAAVHESHQFAAKKDYPAANSRLDRLEALLQQDAAAVRAETARLATRQKELLLRVKQAGPEAQAQAPQAVKESHQLAARRDYAAANARLDKLEALLRPGAPPPPPPPPPPAGDAAKLAGRLKKLLQDAQSGTPQVKDQLKQAAIEAQALAAQKNYAAANARLDRFEAFLKQASAPAPDSEAGRLAARQKEWVLKAQTAPPAVKDRIKAAVSEALVLGRKQDFAAAHARLDELEALLQPGQGPAADGPADPKAAAVYRDRLRGLQPEFDQTLAQARAADPGRADQLNELYTAMTRDAEAQRFGPAVDKLDKLGAVLKAVQRVLAARAEVGKATGPDHVAFVKCKLDWDRGRKDAAEAMRRYQQSILTDPEVQADPRKSLFEDIVNDLGKALTAFDDGINGALDAAATAGNPADRDKARRQALDHVARYRKALQTNPIFKEIEDGPFGAAGVYGRLANTLDELTARLSK